MSLTNIVRLRHLIDELDEAASVYGNQFLEDMIAEEGSINAAASAIWGLKAGRYAALVDVAEAGASRKLSQLTDNARKMSAFYNGGTEGDEGGESGTGFTTTRPIERS